MGDLGEIGTSDVRGRDPNRVAPMGDNGPHPDLKGGVSGYWDSQGGVEGMCSSG